MLSLGIFGSATGRAPVPNVENVPVPAHFRTMKTALSLLIVIVAGLAGLALVFTDVVPVPLGTPRILVGALLYLVVGFALARMHRGGRPLAWAIAAGWGPILLGLYGVWVSLTDRASGDWGLALVFLVGPAIAAGLGSTVARLAGPTA